MSRLTHQWAVLAQPRSTLGVRSSMVRLSPTVRQRRSWRGISMLCPFWSGKSGCYSSHDRTPQLVADRATSNESLSSGTNLSSSLRSFFPLLSADDLTEFNAVYPLSAFDNATQQTRVGTGESELRCAVSSSRISMMFALIDVFGTCRRKSWATLGRGTRTHMCTVTTHRIPRMRVGSLSTPLRYG